MHADEVHIDAALVRRLIAGQFPQWAGLPLQPIRSGGTDNAIYRLGRDVAVRLPRRPGASGQASKEQQWLPLLAPRLPLGVPVPIGMGMPGDGYPYHWSVYRWLPGESALASPIADLSRAARDLARFICALQQMNAVGGPAPGERNSFRGEPLANRDAETRAAITRLTREIDTNAALAAWEVALHAPSWNRPPVWIHGDLHPANMLVQEGRLSAVVDFGCLGVGDPACDVMAAWTLLSAETRGLFRAALNVDDATWVRGRGWALSFGLIALPYYLNTNPVLVEISRRAITEVLADHRTDA